MPSPLSSSQRPSSWMNCLVRILVFHPTLCFSRIPSIPIPIKVSWRATYLHQALGIESWMKYIPYPPSKGEPTSKQSTEIRCMAAEGCTRYHETLGLGSAHSPWRVWETFMEERTRKLSHHVCAPWGVDCSIIPLVCEFLQGRDPPPWFICVPKPARV